MLLMQHVFSGKSDAEAGEPNHLKGASAAHQAEVRPGPTSAG